MPSQSLRLTLVCAIATSAALGGLGLPQAGALTPVGHTATVGQRFSTAKISVTDEHQSAQIRGSAARQKRAIAMAAAGLAVSGAALVNQTSASAPAKEFGLPINYAEVTSGQLAARLDDAKAAGVTTIQTGATWWYMCPSATSCSWAGLDALVAAAQSRGLKMAVQVAGTPDWLHPDLGAVPAARRRWTLPRNSSEANQLAAFTQRLAARYRGKVARYEIWNEPNLPEFSYPSPNPAGYAKALAAGYRGIKAGDPNALVVSGGLSRADVGFATAMLNQLVSLPNAQTSHLFFDELGIHPYSDSESPLANLAGKIYTGPFGTIDANFGGIQKILTLLDSKGRTSTSVWIGEYGFSTTKTWMDAVPDQRRGLYAQLAVAATRRSPRIAGLVWYAYLPHSATGPEWTIMTADGTRSKTFNALSRALRTDPTLSLSNTAAARALVTSSTCPTGVLSGQISWDSACLGVASSEVTSYDVLDAGVVVASGTGSTINLDTRMLSNANHRITLALYGATGPLGYTSETNFTVSNAVAMLPTVTSFTVSRNTNGTYRARATVTSNPSVPVDAITIAARNAAGENVDFPGMYSGATITPTGLTLDLNRALSPGSYTLWVAYSVGGRWTNLPGGTSVVVS